MAREEEKEEEEAGGEAGGGGGRGRRRGRRGRKRGGEEKMGNTKTGRMAGKRRRVPMSERASAERAIISSIFGTESRMGSGGVDVAGFLRRHDG